MSFVTGIGAGSRLRPREGTENPRASSCKLAFRRICGVCRHFDGAMQARGRCARLGLEDHPGRSSAAECELWERRWQ